MNMLGSFSKQENEDVGNELHDTQIYEKTEMTYPDAGNQYNWNDSEHSHKK